MNISNSDLKYLVSFLKQLERFLLDKPVNVETTERIFQLNRILKHLEAEYLKQ